MSTAITFPRDNDLSGLRLEQTESGHIHSPWFTFPFDFKSKGSSIYSYGSQYHVVVAASKVAFADTLRIGVNDVMVTEKIDPTDHFELMRRLVRPFHGDCPSQRPPPKPVLPENRGAIDI